MRRTASEILSDLEIRVARLEDAHLASETEASFLNLFKSYTREEEESIEDAIKADHADVDRVDVSISAKGDLRINLIFRGEIFVFNGKVTHDETDRFGVYDSNIRSTGLRMGQIPITKYEIDRRGLEKPVVISTTKGIYSILSTVMGLSELLDLEGGARNSSRGRIARLDKMSAYPEFPEYYQRWNSESKYRSKPEYQNTLRSNDLLKRHGFSFLREESHVIYFQYRGVEVSFKLADLSEPSEIKSFLKGASDLYDWVDSAHLAVDPEEVTDIIDETYGWQARNTLYRDLAYFFLRQVLREKFIHVDNRPKKRKMTDYERQKLENYIDDSGNEFLSGGIYIGPQKTKHSYKGVTLKDKYVPVGWSI